MTKKQKIWGIIILIIVGINIVLFTVLSKEAASTLPEENRVSVATSPLTDEDQIYRMQFYARGSECGLYVNDHLIYDTFDRGFGSMVGDHIDNINEFLHNGENQIVLKMRSQGSYFEPGDDYRCKAWIKAGKGKSISEVVAYMHIDYAGQDHFTMDDTKQFSYEVETNFDPSFKVVEVDDGEKEAVISGTLTFHNLPDSKK